MVLMRAFQIEHDCSFYSDLGADLFMFMELVSRIEDEFGKRVKENYSNELSVVFISAQFCQIKSNVNLLVL